MPPDYDLAIVGSGFGGALLAMIARRLGLSVVLLERGKHPRFAIGESTSPLMNLLIEDLARRYDLPCLLPLVSYGSWQRTYPEVVCGLKRGFTFFHHQAGRRFQTDRDHGGQLMVAASPRDEVADTHWLRADVDHFLVREAAALGAEYVEEVKLTGVEWGSGEVKQLTGERHGRPFRVSARLIVDATGPRGFLHKALSIPEASFAGYPRTQALYTHFTGVRRCDTMEDFLTGEVPPYPLDDAALHHVFDGGWMWVLRFGNGVTSAGVALTEGLAQDLRLADGEPAWKRFLAGFPSISEQFAAAESILPFVYAPRLTYRATTAAGEGWALLPSAGALVDPLFSTGMPLTLLGIERLGRILEDGLEQNTLNERLREYGETTLAEVDWTAQLIAAAYAGMADFPRFRAFSMFYFAAAAYSEMARRLEKPHLARRFLGADRPEYAAGVRESAREICAGTAAAQNGEDICGFERRVAARIACLNVAGLCDDRKRHWYGVDLQDVIDAAAKLDLTPAQAREIITAAPWA